MFRGSLAVVAATALTAICWGVYGPVILQGQAAMEQSRLRPFVCVGIAYFIIAVLAPTLMLKWQGEKGSWTVTGLVWSLAAGALGALGALGIILAFSFKGKPVFVMPLVFGLAPVVNTFVTMYFTKTFKQAGPLFLAGLILVAIGAVTVLVAKPSHAGPKITEDKDGTITVESETVNKEGDHVKETITAPDEAKLKESSESAYKAYNKYKNSKMTARDYIWVPIFIGMTALCWGAYGPVLHKGQVAMLGSRLRPLICVGLSYFIIGVLVPMALLGAIEPDQSWTLSGVIWSLAGGAAGALGALGVIMAFTFGGKPIYVMPLIFGCAPVINSFVEIVGQSLFGQISPLFYAVLIIVIVGAVVVLIFAPKGAPHGPPSGTTPAATPPPS
jgi:MFS family permease